ncbi:hypothetical protein TNCV_4475691 [Trichonephila clavipes]|nr:hypothetical protein TNCV_4475691 [Trichonephila clavipes]
MHFCVTLLKDDAFETSKIWHSQWPKDFRNVTLPVQILDDANKKCSYRVRIQQMQGTYDDIECKQATHTRVFLRASRYRYVYHDAARRTGARLQRRDNATLLYPVLSLGAPLLPHFCMLQCQR